MSISSRTIRFLAPLLLLLACHAALSAPAAEAVTSATLQRASQELVDALAPGQREVWAHWTDPTFVFVTEDNEVKNRSQVLEDLKPLPPGYSGWLVLKDFRCTDFGSFAVTTYVIDEHEDVEGHMLHAFYRESDTWKRQSEGWRLVAGQTFAIQQDPPRGQEDPAHLAEFEGAYSLSETTRLRIRAEGDHLVSERDGRAAQTLLPESGDVFFTPGRPRTRRVFTRGPDGHVIGFADRREGVDLVWKRLPQ